MDEVEEEEEPESFYAPVHLAPNNDVVVIFDDES